MVCPKCSSSYEVHRSSRRGWERVLKLLNIVAYRCLDCDIRFYRRARSKRRRAATKRV